MCVCAHIHMNTHTGDTVCCHRAHFVRESLLDMYIYKYKYINIYANIYIYTYIYEHI